MPGLQVAFAINSLEGGGAERVFCRLIDGVRERLPHLQTRLVLLDSTEDAYAPQREIETERLDCRGGVIASVRGLTASMRARPAKVCLSFLTRANCANVLAAKLAGHRALVSERVQTSTHLGNALKGRAQKQMVRTLYRRASHVVAVSEGVRDDLIENFGVPRSQTSVIYNSVDVAMVRQRGEAAVAAGLPDRFLVSVGRLQPNKNFSLLLRGFAGADLDPDLVILGDGPERSELERLAGALGIGARVHFLGFQENPFAIMARAEAFVSASNAEGFPNALVEAMSLGLPAVFTNCPSGPGEILADDHRLQISEMLAAEHGVLVPVNDADALAQAMRFIASPDAHRKFSAASTARAAGFSPAKTLDQYADLIDRAVSAAT